MYTLLSETNKQLAFSLPEPASSERVSLGAGRGLCQACCKVPNRRENCDKQSETNGQSGGRLVTADMPPES